MKLRNRVAIVTGAGSGIGEATVRRFVTEGAKVVVADISDAGAALCRELNEGGHETMFCKADVTREDDIRKLIEQTTSRFGRLDIMIANAGIAQRPVEVDQIDLERWQEMIDINLTGVFLSNQHAIIQMKQQGAGGAVVNVASILGHVGRAGSISYSAAKGGVVNMTRSLGVACAKHGIRVNAVCPGFIDTPLLGAASETAKQQLVNLHPIGRLGLADEIASAILFLASDEASFMIGANLIVDGGYSAQ